MTLAGLLPDYAFTEEETPMTNKSLPIRKAASRHSMVLSTLLALILACNDSGLDYRGADLSEADLTGADYRGTNFSGANLSGANLIGADLNGANLSGANFTGANLSGADLSGATVGEANFTGADLRGATLEQLSIVEAKIFPFLLCEASTLRQAKLDPEVMAAVKDKCPKLLE